MTTISWAGGEDSSYSVLSGCTVSSNTVYYRAAYARCAVKTGASSTTFPPASYAQSLLVSPITSFWLHTKMSNTALGGQVTTNSTNFILLLDAGGVTRLAIQGTGTAGQIKIVTRNAAGTLATLVTSASNIVPLAASGVPLSIDVFINYAVSGQVTCYINGAIVADTGASVNVTTDSATALAQVQFGSYTTFDGVYWSETLIQDTTTLGCSVQTLPPVASGNTQTWTPNTVGNINPIAINDSNFVASATAAQISQWTLATTLPAGAWTIEAVVQEARVSVGTTGPQHFGWEVRTADGTDHTTGTIAPLVGSFANFQTVWATNPHTTAAWNAGELINAGLVSLA
jgi:hypothetical protein